MYCMCSIDEFSMQMVRAVVNCVGLAKTRPRNICALSSAPDVVFFVPIIQADMSSLLYSSEAGLSALRCGITHHATYQLTCRHALASVAPLLPWRTNRLTEHPSGSRCASNHANLRINKARLMHDIHATSAWGQGERWGR
jgi:hypothetical protein